MKYLIRFFLAALVVTAGIAMAAPTVYIPLGSGNRVIAVDAASDKITATFTGVENPHGLVATPDGEYLVAGSLSETPLAAGQPADTPNSKLALIHPAHGHVMLTIPVSGWSHHEAITPDGRYVISTHPTRGGISIVDMQSNQVFKTVNTGPAPNYTVVVPDGKRAFVTNSGNGTISEIDTASWTVTRTLEAGKVIRETSLSPAPYHLNTITGTGKLYVSSRKEPRIWVVDQDTLKVLGEIVLPAGEGHQMAIVK